MNVEDQNTEQAAVVEDPNVQAQEPVTAEGDTAQEDGLDELLKEFDARQEAAVEAPKEPVKTSEPKEPEQIDITALAALERRLNEQEARDARRELDRLCNRLVDGVQADAVDAEAFLIAAARRNPKLEQAYLNRASNPKAWDKIEVGLKNEVAKRFGKKVDKQVTESRDAVASAVRSASTAAPQAEITDADVSSMSKDDFDELSRRLGITPV